VHTSLRRRSIQALALIALSLLLAGSAPALTTEVFGVDKPTFDSMLAQAPERQPAEKLPFILARIESGTATASRAQAPVTAPSTSSSPARARDILASYKARYPILAGVTVEFGNARGFQAIAYYRTGRIVINPSHTASLARIIEHEVWHIIDWRDNNRIDWGENIPPANAASYAR